MDVRHDWLSSYPHEGFEQMRLKSRPREPSPSLTRVGANFYSTVKQQDYSASVWLRRKDKLEHVSQLLFPSLLSFLLDLCLGDLVGYVSIILGSRRELLCKWLSMAFPKC